MERVNTILEETRRGSRRERLLPAAMMVYYIMAPALFTQVSCQETLRLVFEAFNWSAPVMDRVQIAARPAIGRAQARLGAEPLKQRHKQFALPIAKVTTQGACLRGWRIVTVDGSTLDVGDTAENDAEFGRPGVGRGYGRGHPKLRFCALVQNRTHAFFGSLAVWRGRGDPCAD